jgi:S-adenosylmethionine-diacylglycerol 3-amino-3-carboxypropyl transferase
LILQEDIPFAEITDLPPVHSEVLEDERPIRAWLQAGPEDVAVSIASAGDNVLCLALDQPAKLYGVDISPAQISFCRAKSAALGSLGAADITSLMGTYPGPRAERGQLLRQVLDRAGIDFPPGGARSLAEQRGLLHIGIFDQLVGTVREQINAAVGDDIVHRITLEPARDKRSRMWADHDLSAALAPVFRAFFDEDTLDGIFTPKRHRALLACTPFPAHLLRVIKALLLDGDPAQNYYLHRWALGGYLPGGPVPPYLQPARLPLREAALSRIDWVASSLLDFLQEIPAGSVRCFNLSNVLDWSDDDDAMATWDAITRSSSPGARVFARSFLLERPHQDRAARLGWRRDQVAEQACLARERVGYYPSYELWSRAA